MRPRGSEWRRRTIERQLLRHPTHRALGSSTEIYRSPQPDPIIAVTGAMRRPPIIRPVGEDNKPGWLPARGLTRRQRAPVGTGESHCERAKDSAAAEGELNRILRATRAHIGGDGPALAGARLPEIERERLAGIDGP